MEAGGAARHAGGGAVLVSKPAANTRQAPHAFSWPHSTLLLPSTAPTPAPTPAPALTQLRKAVLHGAQVVLDQAQRLLVRAQLALQRFALVRHLGRLGPHLLRGEGSPGRGARAGCAGRRVGGRVGERVGICCSEAWGGAERGAAPAQRLPSRSARPAPRKSSAPGSSAPRSAPLPTHSLHSLRSLAPARRALHQFAAPSPYTKYECIIIHY